MQQIQIRPSLAKLLSLALMMMFLFISSVHTNVVVAQSEPTPSDLPEPPIACPMIMVMPYLDHVAMELGMSTAELSALLGTGKTVLELTTVHHVDPEMIVAHYVKYLQHALPLDLDGQCGISIPGMIDYHATEIRRFVFGNEFVPAPTATPTVTTTSMPLPLPELTPIFCADIRFLSHSEFVADELGLSVEELQAKIVEYGSVAAVVEALNIDPETVVAAYEAYLRTALQINIDGGCDTQATIDWMVTDLVDGLRMYLYQVGEITAPDISTIDWFATIGTLLGMDNNELLQSIVAALVNGQSIADIAIAHQVDVAIIIDEILEREYTVIAYQLTNGQMTIEAAQARMQVLPQVIEELLTFSIQSVNNNSDSQSTMSDGTFNTIFTSDQEARIRALIDAQNLPVNVIYVPLVQSE